jgi:glucosamine--fructose-6-phosphate aminotransferase (isomerizing)
MFSEAAAAGDAVAGQLVANREIADGLAHRLRLGIPVVSFSPSLTSLHGKGLGGKDVLFLAISQSGVSPDIVEAADRARAGGALVCALVNVTDSPLARAADCVIPLHAGPELSVAATKSFIASLAALLQLVGAWSANARMINALAGLPAALARAWQQEWDAAAPLIAARSDLFVIGRGLGLGVAQELALKFKETCGIHAEAFSGAEVQHGPTALIREGFPVIVLAQADESRPGLDALAAELAERGALVFTSGIDPPGAIVLPTLAADPVTGPVLAIQSAYRLVNATAIVRGLDPDAPPHLAKVTRTR